MVATSDTVIEDNAVSHSTDLGDSSNSYRNNRFLSTVTGGADQGGNF